MAAPAFLGNGILRPFVRDQKNDFANGSALDLIRSTAGQILGTRCDGPKSRGELPWRGEFGSRLYLLRHKSINTTNRELARFYAQDALRRWEPRILVTKALLAKDSTRRALIVQITFDVIARNVAGNRVIFSGVQVATTLAR